MEKMNKYTDITIHPLSSSIREARFLLSYNGHFFEANHSVVELLEELQSHQEEHEAINAYILRKNGKYTQEQVLQILDKYIFPLFEQKKKKRTFLYEKELFPASSIVKFSNKFSFLFNKVYISLVFIIAVSLDMYFFTATENLLIFNSMVDVYVIIGILAFMLASSFFHELGHASACKYYGLQHGGIGFGLYLNFPVFYTDVSEVWKLGRLQRCVVNIAGIYFQCYLLIMLVVIFLFTGNDIIRYLILTINFGFLMTLNPFFKFDGYWIASDLLGIPNLRSRSKEFLQYIYKRMCKIPTDKLPYLLQARTAERFGLLIYSIVVNLFMGFYFLYIIPKFLYKFVQTFPNELNELILYISNRAVPPFALLRNIGIQMLFLSLLGYMLWKILSPIIKKHVRK